MRQDAIIRNLEIIGEAAGRVAEELPKLAERVRAITSATDGDRT